jgi:hypothetical protein
MEIRQHHPACSAVPSRVKRGSVLGLIALGSLAGCHQSAQWGQTNDAQAAAATPARTPPDQKSKEAKSPQISMARAEGQAYQRSLDYMVEKVAAGGGAKQRSGDYLVAYAEEKAEGLYSLRNGKLEWDEPKSENAHLEVSVSDGSDGRFIPYLKIWATLTAPDGRMLGPFEIPFVWHPGLFHYGRNIATPGDGLYTIRIRIEPPEFQRHDEVNGRRYSKPVEVIFQNAAFKTGRD